MRTAYVGLVYVCNQTDRQIRVRIAECIRGLIVGLFHFASAFYRRILQPVDCVVVSFVKLQQL